MPEWKPADWKALARTRLRVQIEPKIAEIQRILPLLAASGILADALVRAGIANNLYLHVCRAVEVEKRYSTDLMVKAVLAEFGLGELVNLEEIERFKWPD